MLKLVLVEPEIPENTGNVIRLCANVGAELHLVRPYGFIWDEKRMKRSAMDYLHLVKVVHHPSTQDLLEEIGDDKVYLLTTKATSLYTEESFQGDEWFLFGSESKGLSMDLLEREKFSKIKINMQAGRSINLANAVAILAYEVRRQIGRQ